ncbi:hypothetical protein NUJ28_18095 [Burkholderia multivorans]|uniref:hypothetical protein n=1 Tax=Burkholderia multivorans TaxID=87883 RepID=UPI0021DA991B|nr:hypothetical protein [Burkholderia multivorans]UXZ64036.1 hypothetical protein NUJ28_18095 [Burkholderia multivorans]
MANVVGKRVIDEDGALSVRSIVGSIRGGVGICARHARLARTVPCRETRGINGMDADHACAMRTSMCGAATVIHCDATLCPANSNSKRLCPKSTR